MTDGPTLILNAEIWPKTNVIFHLSGHWYCGPVGCEQSRTPEEGL